MSARLPQCHRLGGHSDSKPGAPRVVSSEASLPCLQLVTLLCPHTAFPLYTREKDLWHLSLFLYCLHGGGAPPGRPHNLNQHVKGHLSHLGVLETPMALWRAPDSVRNRNNWGNWNKDRISEAVKEFLLIFLDLGTELGLHRKGSLFLGECCFLKCEGVKRIMTATLRCST